MKVKMGKFYTMKKLLFFTFILVILFLNFISAESEVNFHIYKDKVLTEYFFDSVSNFTLRIPYDANSISSNVNYSFEDKGNYNSLTILSGENVSINFFTESMIDKGGAGNYFTYNNYFGNFEKVKLILPDSAVLVKEGIVFRKPNLISTDGRTLTLEWENHSQENLIINYESPLKNNFYWYVLTFFLILIFFIAYELFKTKKLRERIIKTKNNSSNKNIQGKKELFVRNLLEDEKKIIEYLLEKKGKESWTKEIMNALNISKVKLSRKLKSLEKKGLIKKIPYGNENKIRLIK